MNRALVRLAVLLALPAAPAAAQEPPAQPAPAQAPDAAVPDPTAAGEPRLIFEREVFEYPGRSRRDPFQPLTGRNAGPLFSDLRLQLIIYSGDANESIVGLSDVSGNRFRLRRGETVGNATVIDIAPTRVTFSVDDFGLRRREVLDLKANREGAGR